MTGLASYPAQPTWLDIPSLPEGRAITGPEIVQLEAAGCTADDWADVFVPAGFDPDRVRQCHFGGRVVLGIFDATLERSGVRLPTGLFQSTIANSRICDNARVSNVGLMSGAVIGPGALVADCDEVLPSPEGSFGNGVRVGLRTTNADRSVPVVADLPFAVLAGLVRPRPEPSAVLALDAQVDAYVRQCTVGVTVVGSGARITGCRRITGSYLAAGCIVNGATAIADSTLLSDGPSATRVGAGAIVRHSLLQWGAVAEDGAYVERSLLAEASTVTRKGIVTGSAIGPNTTIAEGEVSASVVGPFVGFNHHALLVSACWPEGRGNVGYGANVGSNHTGRAPDQEIHPGEGTFFGLGVNVKMPANFSEAPYTIIATGVDTPAQRLRFPFSLIVPGSSPAGPNNLLPGWGLSRNLYGLLRSVWKFETRNRATRFDFDPDAFRPETMALVHSAWLALDVGELKATYTDLDIPGIGGNLLTEKGRQSGLAIYQDTLRWFALRSFARRWDLEGTPPDPELIPYFSQFLTSRDPGVVLDLYLAAEKERLARVITSKARDDSRGQRTLDDYATVHTPAADDPLVAWARDRFEQAVARAEELRASV